MIQGINGLGNQGNGQGPAGQPDRLREVSRQFEMIFLEMMLKQMRSSTRSLSEAKGDMTRETYEGWQDEAFARSMAEGRGIGLGEVLYRQLQQQEAAKQAAKDA